MTYEAERGVRLEDRVDRLAEVVDIVRERLTVVETAMIRRNGPIANQIEETAKAVAALRTETATRAEMQRDLAQHAEYRFSAFAKVTAALTGAALVALNVLALVLR